MAYQVTYDPAVKQEDLPSIPEKLRVRIRRAIDMRLALAPEKYARPLQRVLTGLWKLRVADYRIVFEIDSSLRHVHVLAILPRPTVYGAVPARRAARRSSA